LDKISNLSAGSSLLQYLIEMVKIGNYIQMFALDQW
jgi:hypothetical protein